MKILKLIFGALLILNFFPSSKVNAQGDFDKIRLELKSQKIDIKKLNEKYPDYRIYEFVRTLNEVLDSNTRVAIKLKKNQMTEVITDENQITSFMKVKDIKRNDLMRVSYIYLEDTTKNGEKLADSILLAYKKGVEFTDLVKKYSKEPNANYSRGDIGWFRESEMFEDFSKAVKKHSKGDIFRVNTKKLGWLVVLVTEEHKKRLEYHLIAVEKKRNRYGGSKEVIIKGY